ncbi:TIM barrel protein [Candidatus Peregrinibacteria bacterium]|nr:TIM barrel protein [Candidatus Peregrinibacteria bacterium]
MSELRFAVAGVPRSTPKPCGTIEGLRQTSALGITAMEIEWVQNVPKNLQHIEAIRETAEALGISLTIHAPYYINLNSSDPGKLAASKERVISALAMGEVAGARSVCVHAAFNLGQPPQKVFDNVRRSMEDILKQKKKLFPHVNLGIETMGKPTQFGTLEEVLQISREFGQYPVIDPAHLHARCNGALNSPEEWNAMFDLYEKELGRKSLNVMHLHYSGIAYGPRGEKHHLPLRESDARWRDFVKVLREREIGGVCVCESPLMEEDTLLLIKAYAGSNH